MQATLQILGSGTSTGIPVPGCQCKVCTSNNPKNKRLRTSAVITTNPNDSGERNYIVIDTTPDFRYQMLRAKIPYVSAILYTHYHADHTLGLEDLRGFNFVKGGPIPCYATAETFSELSRLFSYIFNPDPHYEGGQVTSVTPHCIKSLDLFTVGKIPVQPFPLFHGKLPVTGFRLGDLAYATDCSIVPEESKFLLRGVRTLVLDGLRYNSHPNHFTIPEAIKVAQSMGVERTILIHMTHSVDHDEVTASLPLGVELAFDGLEIPFTI